MQFQLTIMDARQKSTFPWFTEAENKDEAIRKFEYIYADRERYSLVTDEQNEDGDL